MRKLVDAIGWLGAALLLAAFAANSLGYISVDQPLYQALNLLGAAGIALQTAKKRAFPATVMNVVWGIVAAIALWRLL